MLQKTVSDEQAARKVVDEESTKLKESVLSPDKQTAKSVEASRVEVASLRVQKARTDTEKAE